MGRDALGREVKDYSNTEWWGINRKDIEWFPRIDYELCIKCGLCYITCARCVYDWDFNESKPVVARPYNCLVGCCTCANLCPRDAISFPPIGYLRKNRDKARAVAKSLGIIRSLKRGLKR